MTKGRRRPRARTGSSSIASPTSLSHTCTAGPIRGQVTSCSRDTGARRSPSLQPRTPCCLFPPRLSAPSPRWHTVVDPPQGDLPHGAGSKSPTARSFSPAWRASDDAETGRSGSRPVKGHTTALQSSHRQVTVVVGLETGHRSMGMSLVLVHEFETRRGEKSGIPSSRSSSLPWSSSSIPSPSI